VYHDGKHVAFLFLDLLKYEIIEPFMQGIIPWRDINPKQNIEKYELGKSLDVFVQSKASDPDVDETTCMHYMLVFLRGAAEELKN
jgi:hypothetical protein